MKKCALLLIDIQNIYFTEGPFLLDNPEIAAKHANVVLDTFRKEGKPVIHVKHSFSNKGYVKDAEELNEFHDLVKPVTGEKVIYKKFPSAFLGTDLQEYLQENQIEELVVVGMMSHMCVDTTVRICQNYGYNVTVIADACTTMNLAWNSQTIPAKTVHEAYMAGLNGMFAKVTTIEEFMKEHQ